ncbi:probable phospholipase A1 magnifin [Zootermopsis nevadensis]|uniref:Pancreatic lipase-related protein 2 n=1 Tax=Zootermopsis nevadensis TaxID=136037 RepID=A0A067RM73_ZOONE|nr:probable phospholipase A1 magnifin [Zootermopsis nevadensis]KDR21675.1 Pancreatic lipase-related protein 2 [Zootermopsis nevadensis]
MATISATTFIRLFILLAAVACHGLATTSVALFRNTEFSVGRCRLVIEGTCPDPDVEFFLYTRSNPTDAQIIAVNEGLLNLTSSNFNSSHPTKFIIHGYNSDMDLDVLVDIRKAYLDEGDHNVIAVDWSRLCPGPCYPSAVYNAKFTGKCIAQFLQELRLVGASDVHVVGFSLGAHVAGFAANNLRPYRLPRITGLDPAMPFFATVNKDQKLDACDADFVDVIHTNAFVQGKIERSGDVDFYVNGGISQPGCWSDPNPFGCNHHRAPAYFAESITSTKGFWAWHCSGFVPFLLGLCPPMYPAVVMGERVPANSRGFYLVATGAESPFALGKWVTSPEDEPRHKLRVGFSGVNDIDTQGSRGAVPVVLEV